MTKHHNQKSLGDQLVQIAPLVRQTKPSPLPSLMRIGNDGVDHINIWENGKTLFGVGLSHMADMKFNHSIYGKFASMEGFWYYIRSAARDDVLRLKTGYKAREYGDKLETSRIDDFRIIIADANYQKIKQWPRLMEDLKGCTLPLEMYYVQNRNPLVLARPMSSAWLIPAMNEIRSALVEDRAPDFNFLSDKEQQIVKFRPQESNARNRPGTSPLHRAYEYVAPPRKQKDPAVSENKPKKTSALEKTNSKNEGKQVKVSAQVTANDQNDHVTTGVGSITTLPEISPNVQDLHVPVIINVDEKQQQFTTSVSEQVTIQRTVSGSQVGIGIAAVTGLVSEQS